MDSQAFIQLQRMPFEERLERQYHFYEEELQHGYLMGREGQGAVEPVMPYRDLLTGEFRPVLNLGTNNYLGLSHHPYVIRKVCEAVATYGVGTGGSPAFSGYTTHHRELEKRLAALAGHEDAILLPSGFMANLCWVTGLMNRQDILLYDKYSHASVIVAIKMAGVPFFAFDPEDLTAFEDLVKTVQQRRPANARIFCTAEGVRSVDGSLLDLDGWLDVCRRHDLTTILDDAHGLGVVGPGGKGTLEHFDRLGAVDFRMSTCSKGLGAQGAFVSGGAKAIFYLRTYAKPYVFTTALAHPTIAAIHAALDMLDREPELVAHLRANARYLRGEIEDLGLTTRPGVGGIVPLYLPDGVARDFNRTIFKRGVFAHVMEYPMVPPGLERVRFSLMANHTREQLDQALQVVAETARACSLLN